MAASLSAEKWKTFFDTDGRLVDELGLRKTIFSCKWHDMQYLHSIAGNGRPLISLVRSLVG